jgi:sugar lactone lactonase YvrE
MRPLGTLLQIAGLLIAGLVTLPAAQAAPVPQVGTPVVFADGIAGPEGIAFTKKRELVVGTSTGEVLIFDAAGARRTLATLPSNLAGIAVRRSGAVLAASLPADTVWSIDPNTGVATVLGSGIGGPNYIVETKRRRVWVSASTAGTIVDITDPAPAVKASGLSFPNGMAIGKDGKQRYLYVAELTLNRVVRLPINADESLGPLEVYATGLSIPDGLAFDRRGNLLVVGGNRLDLVHAGTRQVETILTGAPMNGPSNIAFGRGRGFSKKDFYVVNFGFPLGSGTQILRFPYNIPGAPVIR